MSSKEARDGLLAAGDPEAAAEAEELLSTHFWLLGERDRSFECIERAVALVTGSPDIRPQGPYPRRPLALSDARRRYGGHDPARGGKLSR